MSRTDFKMSWMERIGQATAATGPDGVSRLETIAVWSGAALLLLLLVLTTALG